MDARSTDLGADSVPGVTPVAVPGWRGARGEPSLSDMFASVRTAPGRSFWRKLLAFLGPGYLVAGGCMDPGNLEAPRAGLPRFLSTLRGVAIVAVGRGRDHSDRSRRGDRHRDRAQSAVPHSA